jgi:hypothetical protein
MPTWCAARRPPAAKANRKSDAEYFVAPRPLGGFVAFSVITTSAPQREAMASEQKVDLFKKAALTAVGAKH